MAPPQHVETSGSKVHLGVAAVDQRATEAIAAGEYQTVYDHCDADRLQYDRYDFHFPLLVGQHRAAMERILDKSLVRRKMNYCIAP